MTGIGGLLVRITALLTFLLQAGVVVAGPALTVTGTHGSTVTHTSTVTGSASASSLAPLTGGCAAPAGSTVDGPRVGEPSGGVEERPAVDTGSRTGTPAPRTEASPSADVAVPVPGLGAASAYFSGDVAFRSLHPDRKPPVDVPAHNVCRITENRLHGEDAYQLLPWPGSTAPSRTECAEAAATSPRRDTDHLQVGSLACGKTPERRLFRVEVLSVTPAEITGRLVVWER
ncbi:hypothetical protein [Actinosynnema pretiosum]|uniref:Uncharacterized protein n=1 Tax=Actinosynnema pretiosum TaxID=42197 RepID=A0A290ZAP9_9PSEU|nr:hypothetical protein [Actinosynnema pretiosum]ATE56053.1 hypothetical protein CNX65_24565 [Actinosynnema pretiosum]